MSIMQAYGSKFYFFRADVCISGNLQFFVSLGIEQSAFVLFKLDKIEWRNKNTFFTWTFTALFWTGSKNERCLIKDRRKDT